MHLTPGKATGIEREQLRELSRMVGKIEALLLAIVLLSLSFAGVDAEDRAAISAALFFYGALVLGFRYVEFHHAESRRTIAIQIWAMIPFVTWAIWFTDKTASPLFNAYLVVIITSALALGMRITLWQLGLIAACFALLGETLPADAFSLPGYVGSLLTQLTPLILVAYVTSVFSADMRFWMNKAKLRVEIDPFTGVHNMRGFAIAADRIFAAALRNDVSAGMLIIDVGNLDALNRADDKELGNGLLRSVAKSIGTGLRRSDVLARRGESEFVALLAETSADGALSVAERIRAAAAGAIAIHGARPIAKISMGLALHGEGDRGIDDVLTRAERAMHLARERGGDRVGVSGAPNGSSGP